MSAIARLTKSAAALLQEYDVDVRGLRLVVGCSGGVDSTMLLHVLVGLGATPVVAHVNYGLRGADSDADEQHVRSMADSLGLPVRVHVVPEPNDIADRGSSVQSACRDIRYDFFADVMRTDTCHHLALGHTLDDQAETVLMHLARGAGVDGLAGMPCVRSDMRGYLVLRPLLSSSREELVDVATRLGIQWREDASNESDAYARNRVRTTIATAVSAALGNQAWLNIGKSANRVRQYLDADTSGHVDEYIELVVRDDRLADVEVLRSLEPVVRKRVLLALLKRWYPDAPRNAAIAAQIDDLLDGDTGKSFLHNSVRVVRDRDVLHFEPPARDDDPGSVLLLPGSTVQFDGSVFVRMDGRSIPTSLRSASRDIVFIDSERLPASLNVRRWEPGDRITPLGMSGRKLVSDLLTDRKVSTAQRKTVPVVATAADVVWCVGIEIGAQFRVTDSTRRVTALARLPE